MKTKLRTNYSKGKFEFKLLLSLFFILISNALQAQNANEFPVLTQNGILICGGQTTISSNYPTTPNAGSGWTYTDRIYQWKRNGTLLFSSSTQIPLTVTLEGTYTFEVIFYYFSPPFQTTSLMRSSAIEVVYDSITSLSVSFINGSSSSVCFGSTTTLRANNPSGTTVGWERNDGDENEWYSISNGDSAIISITGTIANSTFEVRARAYSDSGCPVTLYSDVKTIEVMPQLTPPVVSGPDQACYASLMTLTAAINNPNTPVSDPRTRIEWESYSETFNQWSDNFISSPLYTNTLERIAYPSTPSYFNPQLRYDRARINYNGCYSSTSTIVTTIINPQPTVQISSSGTATICEGESVNLAATVGKLGSTGTLPVSYQWKVDGNNVPSNGNSATYTATMIGDYSVTVLHAAGCAAISIEKSISLDTGPVITSQPAPLSVTKCQGQAASFSVSAIGAGLSYQWRKEGVAITGNPSALTATLNLLATTPSDASSYDVIISGCTVDVVSDAATLTIIPAPQVSALLSNLTYCEGDTVPAIALSGMPAGVTFNVTGGSAVGLANQTGVTTIPSFTAATGAATITVTPTTTTCEGILATYTITVIASPLALNISPNSAAMCLNDAPVLLTSSYGFTSNYCTPVVNGGSGNYINNVTFGNINNTAFYNVPTYYTYFSGLTANVVANGVTTYPASITRANNSEYPFYVPQYRIWIDFNQNGLFEASESVFSSTSPNYVVTGTVTIPTTAYNGITRMRVAVRGDFNTAVEDACLSTEAGEFEDYNISITGGVNPLLPVVWSPTTGLFTDAAGTTAYVGGSTGTVYAKPSTTTTYIATAANAAGCSTASNSTPVNVIIPTVTATYSLCTGAEFTVTTVSNLNNVSYQWTVPPGFSNPGNVSSFTSSVIGNYSVVITDLEYGCSSSASTFTVNNLTATISGSSYRCDSGGTVLTSNVPSTFGTNVSYQWQRNAIDVPSNGNSATYTATLAGDYSVTIANNSSNCSLSSAPFAVSDFEYISFETLGGGSYCSGDGLPVTLSGSQTEVTYGLLKLHPEDPGAFDVVAESEGTGGPLTFPNILEGEYVIYSIFFDDESNFFCDRYMTGTVTISFSETISYADSDGDGYGNPLVTQTSCDQPIGYVTNNLDCNDAVFAINPGATEICWNNIDDNCNDTKSEGCVAIPVFVNNPITITNFSTALSAVPYSYAGALTKDYRFEIRNMITNEVREFTQTGVFARFFNIPTDIRGFNIDYQIRASAVINGEIVPYAVAPITVTSPRIPTTKLSSFSCDSTITRANATITANPIPNVIEYTFRIRLTSDNGPTPTYYYLQSTSRFIGCSSFDGLTLADNTSYTVSVQYSNNNSGNVVISSYGPECTLLTQFGTSPVFVTRTIEVPFTAIAYPNPFSNSFNLEVESSNTTPIMILVYDMLGRIVEQRQANVNDLESTSIGANYPSGVYNVIVTQDDETRTVRVVKR